MIAKRLVSRMNNLAVPQGVCGGWGGGSLINGCGGAGKGVGVLVLRVSFPLLPQFSGEEEKDEKENGEKCFCGKLRRRGNNDNDYRDKFGMYKIDDTFFSTNW